MDRVRRITGRRGAVRNTRSRRLVAYLGAGLVLAACAPPGRAPVAGPSSAPARADSAEVAREITTMLRASAEAWSRGDLEGFLDDYSDDPTLVFIGSSGVVRGKAAVRDRYQASYFSGQGEADDLAFDQLEVRPLAPGVAVAHGRWTLFKPGFETQTVTAQGRFTLVFRREADGRWRIIHDHSS